MRFRREQAMLLNLTDVFTNEGRVRKESVAMELKEFKSRMGGAEPVRAYHYQ